MFEDPNRTYRVIIGYNIVVTALYLRLSGNNHNRTQLSSYKLESYLSKQLEAYPNIYKINLDIQKCLINKENQNDQAQYSF